MALEDFFTLTEMKDGLTVPVRVEELVAVMKKEKDCLVKNIGDAMRQWSTVASVIAATDNKDCLDHFIQSDGLLFIDRWLKDAQKFSADAGDCFIEESILALLQALEKLKIDNHKLNSPGICCTVMDLLSHKSNNVQDKAKALLENLKPLNVSGDVKLDSVEAQALCVDRTEPGNRLAGESGTSISTAAISHDQKKSDGDRHVHQLVGNNAASAGSCVDQQSEGGEAVVKESDKLSGHISESDLKEVKDNFESSVRKEACSSEQKSVTDCPDIEQGADIRKEGRRWESLPVGVNVAIHNASFSNKLDKAEVYPASVKPEPAEASPSLDKKYVLETDGKPARVTDNHADSSGMKSMLDDLHTTGDDGGVLMNCTVTLAQKNPSEDDTSRTKILRNSPADEVAERVKHGPSDLRDSRGFELSRGYKSAGVISKTSAVDLEYGTAGVISKTSAVDLEYGTVDALEVACLVAKEVERQVIEDSEEQFGSFSMKSSRGAPLHLAGSSDSFNGEKDQHADCSTFQESPVEKMSVEDSSGASTNSEDSSRASTNSDNVDAEEENSMKVAESLQVTNTAPEAAHSPDKGTSEIDLNLDICSEAEDGIGNSVSNPVAVISASRAKAASGLPASPLKFEGDLGWKGSAPTSAFKPASSRRTSDCDRAILVDEGTDASRQGQDFVFDLNLLAEDGDEKMINPIPSEQNLTIPGAPSVESLVEPSPRRSEKLCFDLNQLSEDGDAPFSSSPASSSSSLKPATRNFDLNDRPLNFGDLSDLQPALGLGTSSHKINAYGGLSDDSVISIMGAKVKKNPFVHHAPISFFNGGRASEPSYDANMARSGSPLSAATAVQYAPPSMYSYNGIAVSPAMSFPHHIYGPGSSAAYMVDSRGVSIVPQLMGAPPSSFQAPFAHQPAFTSNMMSPLPGLNGASSSRPPLVFNPGFVIDRANRADAGGFRQFIPGQVRSAEEHLQPLFPGIVGGKRKEPDGVLEPYVTNYKHHQPPHL